ncbi:MAG TPA: hypothetical protein VEJ47_05825 [Candidatus Eremiobacteraceae bacterium]|nr:hypothetical protein [Candidatus Eremiobacteraceae bacterium]
MLSLYSSLLRLYPAAHRREFGEEMMHVLKERQTAANRRGPLSRIACFAQETSGLLRGAFQEHARQMIFPGPLSFSPRNFTMRSEFRFPKATALLMAIILLVVIMAIEKAKAISDSVPHTNAAIGPIQPAHLTIVPTLLIALAGVCVIAALSWLVLFALHRSGTQRLAQLDPSSQPRSGTGLHS